MNGGTIMIEIEVKQLAKMYGGNTVFDQVNFAVKTGEKIGLIGANGCGKTTLMRILSGEETSDSGDIFKKKGLKCGYLAQIPTYPESTLVIEVLMEAFGQVGQLKHQMTALEEKLGSVSGDMDGLLAEYSRVQEQFIALDGYSVDEKLKRIIVGMSFTDQFLKRRFMALSGGEKTKTMLGRMLLEAPDVMLLDEPTNHLDIKTLEWLETYIKESRSAMIMISHDRYFLDHTIDKIVELERGATVEFYGNYTAYIDQKEELKTLQAAQFKQQEKKIGEMEAAVKRFRDWGTRADNEAMFKKAKAMEKRIERMDKVEKPKEDKAIRLNFEMSNRSGQDVISLEEAVIGYDTPLFKSEEMTLKFGERLVLLGDNGTGKTTLFKVIQGRLPLISGQVKVGESVKIGELDQEIYFDADDKTILTYFREETLLSEGEARQRLARYLFTGESVFKRVESLSGGEKVRLKLALLMEEDINMLLLDEPTNHIDIASRETLEQALVSFKGTILFVSHDRFFIEKVATCVAEVADHKLKFYSGDYKYFKEEQAKEEVAKDHLESETLIESRRESTTESRGKVVSEDRQRQSQFKKLTRKLEVIEKDIQDLEIEMAAMTEALEDTSKNYAELADLNEQLEVHQVRHDDLSIEWLEITETIERFNL
jgi:ATPase subunit of ABC transporter with duplicated ATPase domains